MGNKETELKREITRKNIKINHLESTLIAYEDTILHLRETLNKQQEILENNAKNDKEIVKVLNAMIESQGSLFNDIVDLAINGIPKETIKNKVKKEYPDYLKPL